MTAPKDPPGPPLVDEYPLVVGEETIAKLREQGAIGARELREIARRTSPEKALLATLATAAPERKVTVVTDGRYYPDWCGEGPAIETLVVGGLRGANIGPFAPEMPPGTGGTWRVTVEFWPDDVADCAEPDEAIVASDEIVGVKLAGCMTAEDIVRKVNEQSPTHTAALDEDGTVVFSERKPDEGDAPGASFGELLARAVRP